MKSLRKVVELNGQSGNANRTFTADVAVGVKEIEHVALLLSGTTKPKTALNNLKVLVNAKEIQTFKTVAHLEAIMAYYAMAVNTNEIRFDQYLRYLQNAAQSQNFNLGLSDVDTLQISAEITGASVSADFNITARLRDTVRTVKGATSEQLRALNALGVFRRVTYHGGITLTGASTTEITKLPKRGLLQAMHLMPADDVITAVRLKLGDTIVWDMTATEMANEVTAAGRVAQSTMHHIDMMLSNEMGDEAPIEGLNEYVLEVTHSGGTTLEIYQEAMDSWRSSQN